MGILYDDLFRVGHAMFISLSVVVVIEQNGKPIFFV